MAWNRSRRASLKQPETWAVRNGFFDEVIVEDRLAAISAWAAFEPWLEMFG